MNDTVKLIIEIPKDRYTDILRVAGVQIVRRMPTLEQIVAKGTPLDDVKAEIKAMFPPSGNWMYDEECEHEHTVCEVLSDVLQILDNIGKAESEDQE